MPASAAPRRAGARGRGTAGYVRRAAPSTTAIFVRIHERGALEKIERVERAQVDGGGRFGDHARSIVARVGAILCGGPRVLRSSKPRHGAQRDRVEGRPRRRRSKPAIPRPTSPSRRTRTSRSRSRSSAARTSSSRSIRSRSRRLEARRCRCTNASSIAFAQRDAQVAGDLDRFAGSPSPRGREQLGGISYPLLSDFYPHGAVAERTACSHADGMARAGAVRDRQARASCATSTCTRSARRPTRPCCSRSSRSCANAAAAGRRPNSFGAP